MKKIMTYASLGVLVFVAGCGAARVDISEYSPIVDVRNEQEQRKFNSDIVACRRIGEQTQEAYKKKADAERGAMIASTLLGAALGAATGSIIGDHTAYQGYYTRTGAVAGAAAGVSASASQSDYIGIMERLGAQGVVDRCMHGRGWNILNREGLGIGG